MGDGIWSTFRRSALNIVEDSDDTMDAASVSHQASVMRAQIF